VITAKNAAHFPRGWFGRLASLATRAKRLALALGVLALFALVAPALGLAHDQPETKTSRWVMADWMLDTFFVFSGLAVIAFLAAWKAGHFHELDRMGGIPLLVEEEDYYTPEWALDEEEWADGDA
jgi:hypothetical protein